MCTLTFVPTATGFLVASNRDESIHRAQALPPQVHDMGTHRLLMPQDPEKSGTWIALSDAGRLSVLLNGAHERHQHRPPYRLSRGVVLMDAFKYPDFVGFQSAYDFDGIEPFTIISIERHRISDFRWSGEGTSLVTHDPAEPHVWCSAQMYPQAVQQATGERLHHFLSDYPDPTAEDLLTFNINEAYDLKMARAGEPAWPMLKTVSISTVAVQESGGSFRYHDRLSRKVFEAAMPLLRKDG